MLQIILELLPTLIPIIEDCFENRERGLRIASRFARGGEASIKRGTLALLDHAAGEGRALDQRTLELRRQLEVYEPRN